VAQRCGEVQLNIAGTALQMEIPGNLGFWNDEELYSDSLGFFQLGTMKSSWDSGTMKSSTRTP
jgi:hypothetical protein